MNNLDLDMILDGAPQEGDELIHKNLDAMCAKKFGDVSDGYHTFDELYEHRHHLWIALLLHVRGMTELCLTLGVPSKERPEVIRFKHYEGWFLLGVSVKGIGQMSYHLPMKYWDMCKFAEEKEWDFDGHTSADVLERIQFAFFARI